MKNNNVILFGAAALLLFLYCRNKKKKSMAPLPLVNTTTDEQLRQVVVTKDQTVNFVQMVPNPASIMDMPAPIKAQDFEESNCGCRSRTTIGSLPFIY